MASCYCISTYRYLAGQKEYEIELQFSSQTSKLLNKEIALTEKPAPSISKDASSGVEKGMPPSIVASTVSIQSSRPPAYSDIYTENNLVSNDDDVKPGPSHAPTDNLTIDVPAVPQRKVLCSRFSFPFHCRRHLNTYSHKLSV